AADRRAPRDRSYRSGLELDARRGSRVRAQGVLPPLLHRGQEGRRRRLHEQAEGRLQGPVAHSLYMCAMGLPSASDDDPHMARALEAARSAIEHEDVPIGAVVVHEGAIVGTGHNARELDRDPTAHAELIALRQAAKTLGRRRLTDCALYVTLEPCAMCAGAAVLARVDLVVFAAPDPK